MEFDLNKAGRGWLKAMESGVKLIPEAKLTSDLNLTFNIRHDYIVNYSQSVSTIRLFEHLIS